jgi:hypothetical protein
VLIDSKKKKRWRISSPGIQNSLVLGLMTWKGAQGKKRGGA